MTNKIEVLNIEEDTKVNREKPLEAYSIQELIDLDWKEYLKKANYNKDPYKMCEDCIAEQKRKYNGRTPIVCNGLKDYRTALGHKYSDEVLDTIEKEMNEEELLEIKGVYSAPEWFKSNVKDIRTYSPRFHQDLVLKCSAKHKVIRMGRRCIAEYEEVLLADGSYKQIKDITIGDKVFSNRNGVLVENTVLDVIDNGYKEYIYEIKLESGRTVRITEDHEILTNRGWKSIKTGLKEGSFVSEVRKHPIKPKENVITETEAKLLGYLLTDGYLSEQQNQTIKFTSQTKTYIDEVSELTEQLFGFKGTIKKRKDSDAYDIWLTDGNRGTINPVKTWLKDLGILGVKKKFRNSTQLLSTLPDNLLGLFLNRTWAGDGSISLVNNTARPNGKRVELALTTGDDYFARTISNILFSRGIRNSLYWEKPRSTKDKSGRIIQGKGNYKIRISSSEAVNKFFGLVGNIYGKEANCILAKTELEKRSKRNQRPFQMDSDFEFSRIKKIHKIEKEVKVYDLTVENDHNFVTNGVVTHNCGKTFSVILDIIHRIETTDRPLNILVSAPLLTMINEIERTLVTLVHATGKNDFIVSKKSSPALEVKFFNGSVLQGITLSNDGTSARGKKADLLWVDEMDFVNRKALEALQAIEMDNPNVEVIYTSTPIGQGNLYQAEQLENTKAFHFPSYVIPHYSDAMHSSMKASLSDIAFAQETIGLYGLDEAGVFQVHYIEDGIDLHIPQVFNQNTVLMNRSRFIVFIGVDWNHDLNGTRVVVTAYDKNTDRFFVIEKEKIAKQNLTQAIAVNLVVELNRKYNADHIICDEGYGIGQVTELRTRGREQYGKVPANHPDIKLVDTMSVQFGSSLTIRDPSTHQELKKNTKQYIVENAQKLLEEKRLTFNDIDDNELIMQMKNYTQLQGEGGRVKYKPKDKKIGDHDLDAFMLCLYGFDYHYGEYIKPRLVEHGALLNAQGIQYDVPKANETASLVASLGRKGSGFIGGKKPFKMRKRW